MLPRKYRISNKDFIRAKEKGRKVFGPLFGLLIVQGKEESGDKAKFGFIVSKKIDKRAVIRNKIKRRLDQALLSYLPKIKPGAKVVFLAKKILVDKNFFEVQEEIGRMLRKAKLLQEVSTNEL